MSLKERIMLEEQEGEKLLTQGSFFKVEAQAVINSTPLDAEEAESIDD